ncbi:alpha/beta fold hydrolase [Streptomyces sp. NBC_01236]|uniref:alpha/beta fold hydrolase n=1 Tax=Streptomyces sp. NBC_01236 TaxID=2903789 RepID=UPI002E0E510A|nr:alpha/beta hydrolase [Streptomyces sp. NBC_01236]
MTPTPLHHADHPGTAPALLLVHGWGGNGGDWDPTLPYWRHRVIVPDLRGHGRSPKPGEGYGARDFAADLAELLRGLDTGPVVAVGHSMGGQAVTALAVEHPELVRGLVVVDPAYGADEAEAARIPAEQEELRAEGPEWAARFVTGAFRPGLYDELRDRQRQLMTEMDTDVLVQCRNGMYLNPGAFGLRPATVTYLARRECPVLGVYATPGAAEFERGTLTDPRSRVTVFDGTGHYLHEERPREFVELVEHWATEAWAGVGGADA